MLLFVPPDRQAKVAQELAGLIQVSFRFEFTGSQIAYYNPGLDYSNEDRIRRNANIDEFRELTEKPSYI